MSGHCHAGGKNTATARAKLRVTVRFCILQHSHVGYSPWDYCSQPGQLWATAMAFQLQPAGCQRSHVYSVVSQAWN